jgi:ribosome-associated toxin RatA of RatAB toxin-antitoxin module
MASAEFHEIIAVDKDKFFQAVLRYEDYPQFVEGCTQVKVERKGPGQARVTYHVSMMKDVVYTLDHREDSAAGVLEWSLVESDTFRKNSGRWVMKSAGPGKTDVLYEIEVDFKIPVPGFILNRIVKGSLPAMIESFRKRASK